MAKILVFVEFSQKNGQATLKKGSLELLSIARKSGLETDAVALGAGAKSLVSALSAYGVKSAFVCEHELVNSYNPQVYTQIVGDLIKSQGPQIVLASSSMLARDLFPRVAARVEAGVVSDCTDLQMQGDQLSVRRPMYSGKCTAAVEFANCKTKIVLMRSNQLPVEAAGPQGSIQIHELPVPPMDLKSVVQQVVKGTSEKLDLTEANIIVSGGRGMKEASNFKILEDLANVLGATVGASRAVVDAGWVPHSMQVGQTGKTVTPSLYIACGISGAIQHLAGMSGSKVIVAINKDPSAPIFQKATYGIVGDVFEVVPKLTEEFKKILHS